MDTKKFLYIESSQIPLTPITEEEVKKLAINPVTGKPYRGIILKGCFADLSNEAANNNKRFYSIPEYLELVKILRKQVHSKKGVYGELEHPKGYNVDFKLASHKILDLWYDEAEKKVYGYVLLLQRGNGLLATQIIESGGQLAISARAAGTEVDQPDGTKYCVTKLLVTYDLVYHPGFSAAVLDYVCLNESLKMLQEASKSKIGFSGILYDEDLKKIDTSYATYINLNEKSNCFYEWLFLSYSNLNESKVSKEQKIQNKQDDKVLQDKQVPNQNKLENDLESATKKDLKQSKSDYFKQIKNSETRLKMRQGASFYDGSAGFVNSGAMITESKKRNC